MHNLYPGWQIEDLEETERLQEIQAKMDPRTETRVRDGRLFKSGELLRRRLVHEGTLLWKTSGARLKGTQHFAKNTNKKCNSGIALTQIMCGQSSAEIGFRTPLKISNCNKLTITAVRQRGIISQGPSKIKQLEGGCVS